MPLAHRYALYLAPSGPWQEQGSRWLGRCAETGAALERQPGMPAAAQEWTRAPRHYGLHATLKPPFRLIAGAGPSDVDRAAAALAAQHSAFAIELECAPLRGFLAWRLTESDPVGRARIHALANAAVRELDPLRAPPTPEELAKRLRHPLAPAQHALLERWGYPYVFDQFTFHITLSEKLADAELRQAQACIARYADPLAGRPMPVDGVSVYVQPGPGEDFLAARHYRFDGGREDAAGAAYMQGEAAA